MKSRYLLAGLASAALIGFAMPAVSAYSPQDFVTKAANGGMFEVESKQAGSRGGGKDVQGFAQKMITDHGPQTPSFKKLPRSKSCRSLRSSTRNTKLIWTPSKVPVKHSMPPM